MQLTFLIILGAGILFGLYRLLTLALHALDHRVTTGDLGMIGMIGRTETELAPFGEPGRVFVHGEIWRAISGLRIPPGTAVRVTRVDGLMVEVEPLHPERLLTGTPLRSIVDHYSPDEEGEGHG